MEDLKVGDKVRIDGENEAGWNGVGTIVEVGGGTCTVRVPAIKYRHVTLGTSWVHKTDLFTLDELIAIGANLNDLIEKLQTFENDIQSMIENIGKENGGKKNGN